MSLGGFIEQKNKNRTGERYDRSVYPFDTTARTARTVHPFGFIPETSRFYCLISGESMC